MAWSGCSDPWLALPFSPSSLVRPKGPWCTPTWPLSDHQDPLALGRSQREDGSWAFSFPPPGHRDV